MNIVENFQFDIPKHSNRYFQMSNDMFTFSSHQSEPCYQLKVAQITSLQDAPFYFAFFLFYLFSNFKSEVVIYLCAAFYSASFCLVFKIQQTIPAIQIALGPIPSLPLNHSPWPLPFFYPLPLPLKTEW